MKTYLLISIMTEKEKNEFDHELLFVLPVMKMAILTTQVNEQ